MKRNEIKPGEIYAVVRGTLYQGAEATAEPATVVETGVPVDNFNHSGRASRWSSRPSSTTTDGVRVQILDRETLEPRRTEDGFLTAVVKTRQVIATWSDHTDSQRLQRERRDNAAQRAQDTRDAVAAWAERLGINEYQLPTLGGSIQGGVGWDSEYTRNRASLVRVLQLAYELGRKDASA